MRRGPAGQVRVAGGVVFAKMAGDVDVLGKDEIKGNSFAIVCKCLHIPNLVLLVCC
jgi:hypothetical protein